MCPILNYKAWLIVLTVVFERDIAKVMMTTKKTIELEQCAVLQTPQNATTNSISGRMEQAQNERY